MRAELDALVFELKQLRKEGCESVYIGDETLSGLRNAIEAYRELHGKPEEMERVAADGMGSEALVVEKPRKVVAVKATTVEIPKAPEIVLPEGSKETQRDWLRDRVLKDLVCQAHVKPGKQVVFGVGSIDAKIFFCGEAPGAEEEAQGEPFVGLAGQLLTKIIGAMGLKREQVYIGNIMNWRPEMPTTYGNRPPTMEEMTYCLPFLKAQVAVVKPEVIVALGKTAVDGLLGVDKSRRMGSIRGKWDTFEGIPLMPTYHPSYLLRNQSNATKREVWEDLLLVMEKLEMPINEKQRGFFQ